jgi:DNA-binding MarR family transcriptional regulator
LRSKSPKGGLKPIRFDPSFTAEFPGASREAAESMTNVVRTTTELLAELDRRRRAVSHLSTAAIQVLAIVEDEPLPPHVIVDRMLVTSGTMTSLLDRLETKGLVRRTSHPDDRRKILVQITDLGRDILDLVLPLTHAFSRALFSALSNNQQEELIEMLTRIRSRVQELRSAPLEASKGRNKARPS